MNMMMTSAAAFAIPSPTSALTGNGMAADADPIFAAIEAHRAAVASYSAAVSANGQLQEELPKDRRQWSCTIWDPELPADCTDDPRWIASELELKRTNVATDELAAQMVSVKPATLAGCAALLSYALETYGVDDGMWQFPERLADDDGTERPFVYFVLQSAMAVIGGAA